MLKRIELSGIHTTIDPALKRYIIKKIGNLDKYIPRHSRPATFVQIHLKEVKNDHQAKSACEVTLHLPQQQIIIKETAINMYAAVDIAEAKLKLQLKKYKDLHGDSKLRRHLMARWKAKA